MILSITQEVVFNCNVAGKVKDCLVSTHTTINEASIVNSRYVSIIRINHGSEGQVAIIEVNIFFNCYLEVE